MTSPRWIDVHAPAVELKALTWGPPDGPIALCLAEKALTVLMRTIGADEAAQNRSLALLGGAGQRLLDRAAAGAVRRGVTIEEMLLIVNAVADVCSDNDVDIDGLLDLTWDGPRPAADAF
jgi:hypothetical protein